MSVLAVANRKGGAGKTTCAVNLAAAFARRGPVLLVDADPQRSAAAWLPEGPALAVLHAPGAEALPRLVRRAGPGVRVVVDCPPLDPETTAAAVRVADLVLVPLVPSVLDLAAAEPLLEALGPTGRALVVLNQVIPRANVTADARAILASLKVRVARAELGRRVAHIEAALARQAVIDYAPRSRAAAELLALAREVGRLMEAKQ